MEVDLLITGGSGFVGRNLARYFNRQYRVAVMHFQSPITPDLVDLPAPQLDIRNEKMVRETLAEIKPRWVIHAAGNKNVRYCETHPDEARAINALGTQHIAKACTQIGARLVYISTDLVFDCSRGGYREDEIPESSLVYGKTKREGEQFALQENPDCVICRSGGLYGPESPLLTWLGKELSAARPVECFTDVLNTPTYVVNLAEMIEYILSNQLSGIFHTIGPQRVSRYDLFLSFAKIFHYDPSLILPAQVGTRREEMLLQADASLSSETTQKRIPLPFNSVTEGLSRLWASGDL